MKITVITATFNSGKTVRDTIESVLRQTYQEIEYLIIDGGSKDNTMDIVKKYEPLFEGRLRYISEPDKGIYDAMNKGIRMATGDVVGLLNSDDFYTSSDVLQQVADVMADEGIDAVYGDVHYVNEDNLDVCVRYYTSRPFHRSWMRFGFMPAHPSFYCRRKIYEKYGVFRLDCGTTSDYELMLRFLEKYKITTAWLDNIITFMTAGGASNSGFTSRINAHKNDEMAWDINKLKRNVFTLYLKKIRKIPQFVKARFIRTVY